MMIVENILKIENKDTGSKEITEEEFIFLLDYINVNWSGLKYWDRSSLNLFEKNLDYTVEFILKDETPRTKNGLITNKQTEILNNNKIIIHNSNHDFSHLYEN